MPTVHDQDTPRWPKSQVRHHVPVQLHGEPSAESRTLTPTLSLSRQRPFVCDDGQLVGPVSRPTVPSHGTAQPHSHRRTRSTSSPKVARPLLHVVSAGDHQSLAWPATTGNLRGHADPGGHQADGLWVGFSTHRFCFPRSAASPSQVVTRQVRPAPGDAPAGIGPAQDRATRHL